MKRKYVGLFVAAFVLAQSVTAFAANSPGSRPSSGGGGTSSKTQSMVTGKLEQNQAAAVSAVAGGGNVNLSADTSALANAGYSQAVIDAVNTINAGIEPLYRTIGTTNMVGYVALAPVQTAVVAGATSVTLTVPNLVQGLNDIQILYYNSATKAWELMAPTAIDYATQQISVNLSGTTPFTIVYKK